MSISQILQDATTWFAWLGLVLLILTILFFIFNWNGKFRLVGSTIFTLLLSASCWAFTESYRPPINIEGAIYTPIVYDNGYDLVVAQAPNDFPKEAIQPTLEQIASNLKGVGRNRSLVNVRLRKVEDLGNGVSKPVIIGEVLRDVVKNITLPIPNSIDLNTDGEIPSQIKTEADLIEDDSQQIEIQTDLG
ncbi:Ycf51 family protein [Prochlorococcus sp. MIT 1223]|uniref:Ycf51 family protein n=1 Tax=Prochlorococcus sp. MIT 1223 TaxID=3096217 RepID=UPI002A764191|nr:Ycf51 family protein [Prochlorococcus sp. MIT 1223]